MSLATHAEYELRKAGLFDKDSDYEGMLGDAVLELVKVFAAQGHSGFSASMALKVFGKVANYEPLGPLTGDDDEWNEVDGEGLFQNRRCSHVFKDAKGAYDMDGRVFRELNGSCFTSAESRVRIEFPYTPTTEYVDVEREEETEEPKP